MKNILQNKKGAMEMSVGTIVTVVLLMTVLVLGLVLVKSIFSSSTNAVSQIDDAVQASISDLFSEEGKKLAIYPNNRQVKLKKDDDPRGFAFSVKNVDTEPRDFTYTIGADPNFQFSQKCGSSMTKQKADSWLLTTSGSFSLGPGNPMDMPELVLFEIPDTAPPCTIPYKLNIDPDNYAGTTIWITIK